MNREWWLCPAECRWQTAVYPVSRNRKSEGFFRVLLQALQPWAECFILLAQISVALEYGAEDIIVNVKAELRLSLTWLHFSGKIMWTGASLETGWKGIACSSAPSLDRILGRVLGSSNLLLSYLLMLGELPELEHAHKLRQGWREHNSALANEERT